MKRFLLCRLILAGYLSLISADAAYAQIASSSLLQGQTTYNPAAVVLRSNTCVSYRNTQGSGETKTEVTTVYYSYDTNETEEITTERQSVMAVLYYSDWALEAFTDVKNSRKIENANNSGSSVATSGNAYEIESKYLAGAVGLNFNDDLSLGLKLVQEEEKTDAFNINNKDQTLGLGASYRFFENLQVGLGGNLTISQPTAQVENNWLEYYYGAGYLVEINPAARIRLEVGWINSPEDGEAASGSNAANNHRATEESDMRGEIQYDMLTALYRTGTYTVKPLSTRSSESDDTTTTVTMGLAVALQDPGAFVEVLQHQSQRTRGEYTTTTSTVLELNVGMVF
ncbi:MAG: OprD family porin [Proteobacteria bacterium]|nr:OprD family porin [Pseudomonadota bacterium]